MLDIAQDTKDYLIKYSLATVGGFIAAEALQGLVWNGLKARGITRDTHFVPHHWQLGVPVVMAGVMTDHKQKGPILAGLGSGVILSDAHDLFAMARDSLAPDYSKSSKIAYPIQGIGPRTKLHIKNIHISNSLSVEDQYKEMGKLLVALVVMDMDTGLTAGREHPDILSQAREILADYEVDGHNHLNVLKAMHDWAQPKSGNIGYAYDIRRQNHDTFVHPAKMLEMERGDCDDSAVLLASLGESVGVPMGLCMVAQKWAAPNNYNHIIAVGLLDPKYRKMLPKNLQNDERYWSHGKVVIPMEVTRDVPFLYWPKYVKRRVFEIPS